MNEKMINFSLEISENLNKILNDLAKDMNCSKSDVLRRSIALMQFAVEANKEGKKIGSVEQDQELITEITWKY